MGSGVESAIGVTKISDFGILNYFEADEPDEPDEPDEAETVAATAAQSAPSTRAGGQDDGS